MVFSSFIFLFLFLPIFLAAYFLSPRSLKNFVTAIASIFFYAWGAPDFLVFFLCSCSFDYLLALLLERYDDNARRRKFVVWTSVVANTALLAYFKYANFFVDQLQPLLSWLGMTGFHWEAVALPIGISFFTFHKISYVVDVYRRVSKPARNFVDYLLYISLFPQLIAGPIIRYHEIDTQIASRLTTIDDVYIGARRFVLGLSRKILLANPMGAVADNAFRIPPEAMTTEMAWIGAIAYAFQIYFDFSGYSDMAIGLARMLGFRFPENFNRPYLAASFTDFWRRWHMSLSRWMRDYLYIPLGGSRGGTWMTYRNLWTVFLLSGLWHGANWTFVVWGAYHGLFLVLDRTVYGKLLAWIPYVLARSWTFILVCIGWVMFRSESIGAAGLYIKTMLAPWSTGVAAGTIPRATLISDYGLIIFAVCLLWCTVLETERCSTSLFKGWNRLAQPLREALEGIALLLLFALSVMMIGSGSYSPFIYFQF